MKKLSCCLIGHGFILESELVQNALTEELEFQINKNIKNFYMGIHGEFDKIALQTCRKLRKIYSDIEINVVLSSNSMLIKNKKTGYCTADNYSDCNTILYPIEETYYKNKIYISNKNMIDNCDIVICYVDLEYCISGAKKALKYAIKQNKVIVNLYERINKVKSV